MCYKVSPTISLDCNLPKDEGNKKAGSGAGVVGETRDRSDNITPRGALVSQLDWASEEKGGSVRVYHYLVSYNSFIVPLSH